MQSERTRTGCPGAALPDPVFDREPVPGRPPAVLGRAPAVLGRPAPPALSVPCLADRPATDPPVAGLEPPLPPPSVPPQLNSSASKPGVPGGRRFLNTPELSVSSNSNEGPSASSPEESSSSSGRSPSTPHDSGAIQAFSVGRMGGATETMGLEGGAGRAEGVTGARVDGPAGVDSGEWLASRPEKFRWRLGVRPVAPAKGLLNVVLSPWG